MKILDGEVLTSDLTVHVILLQSCFKDLLEQQQIQLETSFKLHLMVDIVKGMLFIHSSEIKCHGNLRSSCCVVDSRFTVKITDFGLPMLRNNLSADAESHYKSKSYSICLKAGVKQHY